MQRRKDLTLAKSIGKVLKGAVARSGLTRYKVAQEVGISQTALNAFISGKSLPSVSTLKKLCTVLGITPNDIL